MRSDEVKIATDRCVQLSLWLLPADEIKVSPDVWISKGWSLKSATVVESADDPVLRIQGEGSDVLLVSFRDLVDASFTDDTIVLIKDQKLCFIEPLCDGKQLPFSIVEKALVEANR